MKKLIALLLCFAMLLSMAVYTFAESKGTINYVSLGSSQTLGYGLPGFIHEKFVNWAGTEEELEDWNTNKWNAKLWNAYEASYTSEYEIGYNYYGFEKEIPGAFSTLIKEEIEKQGYEVNFSQLAFACCRPNDLCSFLYDDYVVDAYYQYFFLNEGMFLWNVKGNIEDSLEYLRSRYRTALKEADFITYDLGAGNFGCQMQSFYGDDNWEEVYKNTLSDEEYIIFSKFRTAIKTKIEEIIEKNNIDPETVSYLSEIDRYAYCLLSYCVSFDKTMEWIYSNNPDVCIVVNQIQNFAPTSLYYIDGLEIYADDVVDILVSMANTYAASYSKYADKYYYARITDDSRVRIILDDILDYNGPEDLNDMLTQAVNNYVYYYDEPTPKLTFTQVYEAAGGKVHDDGYDDALINAYDTFFKFEQYVNTTEYSMERAYGHYSDVADFYMRMITKAHEDYLKGLSNEDALNEAIEYYESLPIEEKRRIKYFFFSDLDSVLHPDYEGHQQMADAVINALEINERGMTSILKGVKNGFKDFFKAGKNVGNFVLEYAKTLVAESLSEKLEESSIVISEAIDEAADRIKEELTEVATTIVEKNIDRVITDIQENVKNRINKKIGIAVKIILEFTK